MASQAMPFLIINYGAEMFYILEQRLIAQNIVKDKSSKVLRDVTKSMFAPQFVQELMRQPELYTQSAVREIFDRLAHSSIMRLSDNSMDKLYDLMTMSCKYQLLSCHSPFELIEITLTHLESVRRSVEGSPSFTQVSQCIEQIIKLCKSLDVGQLADIRHALLGFFQDKRVKVSLFLQENRQRNDGVIFLERGGRTPHNPPPLTLGTIRYFGDNGGVALAETFAHPNADVAQPPKITDPYDPLRRACDLGINLYTAERGASLSPPQSALPLANDGADTVEPATLQKSPPMRHASNVNASPHTHMAKTTSFRKRMMSQQHGEGTGAQAELNSLSALIGAHAPKETIRISLFPESETAGGSSSSAHADVIQITKINRDDLKQCNAELMGIASSFNNQGNGSNGSITHRTQRGRRPPRLDGRYVVEGGM